MPRRFSGRGGPFRADAHLVRVIRARAVAATAGLLLMASAAYPVTLADATHFHVKRTWTAAAVGVTIPLGGLGFSADHTALYAVGTTDDPSSQLRRIPVTRNAVTGEVTALGTSSLVFNGGNPDPLEPSGLDAGLAFGPSGTFFYTYFPANYLAERPGSVGGNETTFALSALGVAGSVGGLAFSPFRKDPGTAFGRLQASSGNGFVYEVPLTAAGGGLYTPGTVTLLVTLPQGGTAGIDYVSGSGTYAGDLLYASYNLGDLHLLAIDAGTGLPIDRVTGVPTAGTARPVDALFASGFVAPPFGITFDDVTGDDLFVSTSDPTTGTNNTIIQIGGFAATFPTTTTTNFATTTTTTATTRPHMMTTTTTLQCGDVDGDQTLNIGDPLAISQLLAGQQVCGQGQFTHPELCDVSAPAGCDVGDALRIAQCLVGQVPCPTSCPRSCPASCPPSSCP